MAAVWVQMSWGGMGGSDERRRCALCGLCDGARRPAGTVNSKRKSKPGDCPEDLKRERMGGSVSYVCIVQWLR